MTTQYATIFTPTILPIPCQGDLFVTTMLATTSSIVESTVVGVSNDTAYLVCIQTVLDQIQRGESIIESVQHIYRVPPHFQVIFLSVVINILRALALQQDIHRKQLLYFLLFTVISLYAHQASIIDRVSTTLQLLNQLPLRTIGYPIGWLARQTCHGPMITNVLESVYNFNLLLRYAFAVIYIPIRQRLYDGRLCYHHDDCNYLLDSITSTTIQTGFCVRRPDSQYGGQCTDVQTMLQNKYANPFYQDDYNYRDAVWQRLYQTTTMITRLCIGSIHPTILSSSYFTDEDTLAYIALSKANYSECRRCLVRDLDQYHTLQQSIQIILLRLGIDWPN